MSLSISAEAVTLTSSKTAGKTIVSSTATTAPSGSTKEYGIASPTLDTSLYGLIGKKFPVGVNITTGGNDVAADLQLQFSLNGTAWTEVQSKAQGSITMTDLPAVDGTVTIVDATGDNKVYTAKATEDLGARQFNVTGTAATATVAFTGNPTAADFIKITDAAGLERTYVAHPSSDFTAGVNQFKADAGATDCADKLELAIENAGGHNGTITVSNNGSGTLTLTQAVKGTVGNTTITETLDNATAVSFTGGEFASAATSLKACIDASAGHNGTITVSDSGAGVLTLTQTVAGSTGNTTITDALTNATVGNFVGGLGSTGGVILSDDIKPNVTGVKLYVADLTNFTGIPYVRFLVNSKGLDLGTNIVLEWQFAFE